LLEFKKYRNVSAKTGQCKSRHIVYSLKNVTCTAKHDGPSNERRPWGVNDVKKS